MTRIKSPRIHWSEGIWPELLTSLLVLIFFLTTVDFYQYFTTEYWWLQDSVSWTQNTVYLLMLIIGASFLPMKKWLLQWPKMVFFIVVLFLVSLYGHQQYSNFYDALQQYPKIKSLSKEWGIPGSWVKITGRNFGQPHEEGKVLLGETKMIIKKWGDKEIIFEIPIVGLRGNQALKITNKHEKQQKELINFKVQEQ